MEDGLTAKIRQSKAKLQAAIAELGKKYKDLRNSKYIKLLQIWLF